MPFVLVNSGATLVWGIRKLLCTRSERHWHGYRWHCRLQQNMEETSQNSARSVQRVASASITLKPSKCIIGIATIEFIGDVIGNRHVQPNADNIAKLQDAKPHTQRNKCKHSSVWLPTTESSSPAVRPSPHRSPTWQRKANPRMYAGQVTKQRTAQECLDLKTYPTLVTTW